MPQFRALQQIFLELRLEFSQIVPQSGQLARLGRESAAELRGQLCCTFAMFN
jgi:hypothetical protein